MLGLRLYCYYLFVYVIWVSDGLNSCAECSGVCLCFWIDLRWVWLLLLLA